MEITREDFERAIELSYKRGRMTPIAFIEQWEIDNCISDIYKFLNTQPDKDTVIEDEYKDKYHIFK